ncbi:MULTISPECIES: adenylate/guanylate cyclase domain-containing protein [unclassified Corynebacterium]|uniref:adenylate/guanylate cyclase domain-containing protein n=1 Tax=unclassified Corynebacterium TaxID=2624378 RepID=UPI00309B036C
MQRLWRNLQWLKGTPWPAYAASVFLCNLIGASAVGLFLGVLLPIQELVSFREFPLTAGIGLAAYFVVAIVTGIATTWMLFKPILRWQRAPEKHDPAKVRYLVMRIPVYQAILGGAIWGIGVVVFGIISLLVAPRFGIVVVISSLFGGIMVALMTYLFAERLVRPVAAEALKRRAPDSSLEPPIGHRLRQTWVLTTGIPIVGILLTIWGQKMGYFTNNVADLIPALTALAFLALITGYIGTILATMSIVDPIRDLTGAINQVRRGDTDTRVPIYDGSEMGVLQAGFNEMMRGLQERQRVRDLFGRYVGSEVARKALEEKPELGGEDRLVAVLFVDVIGSTTFAVENPPEVVVRELNEFFERVVDCVHKNKGIINKFQGDAALAVFGAPLPLDDTAGHALAAARELRQELRDLTLDAGIGVSAGRVVAGHIGAHDRFEYTVIGDAVNQAARLTDLAKDTPGQVLATAATVRLANEEEQARWTSLKSVELRGRTHMTQLARPIRPTLADRA